MTLLVAKLYGRNNTCNLYKVYLGSYHRASSVTTITNAFIDLETTAWTYEICSYSREQYDGQGYHNLTKTISFQQFFWLTFLLNDPIVLI